MENGESVEKDDDMYEQNSIRSSIFYLVLESSLLSRVGTRPSISHASVQSRLPGAC